MKISPARLYVLADDERQRRKISFRDLSKLLDCQPSTFTRIKQGHLPDVNTFVSLINLCGASMYEVAETQESEATWRR